MVEETGLLGEEIARQYLTGKGYQIIARNVRRKWGEIDIVAEKKGVVHFIEVKTIISREKDAWPEENAHIYKLAKVARTAELYIAEHHDEREYVIDVLGIVLDMDNRTARCRFFPQALG